MGRPVNLRTGWTRTPAALASLLLVPALTLGACAGDDGVQQWPDAPDPTLALPAGSSFSADAGDAGPVQDDGGTPFGSLAPDAGTPADRVPAIVERGRLIVGVSQSMNQLGFRDPVSGEMAGFEVDIAHEIARDIFGDPDRLDFRYVDGIDREQALYDGDVDLIIRSMSVTRARQTTLEFSAPYLSVSPRLLVNRDSGIRSEDDLADRTVCTAQNTTSAQTVAQDIPHGRLLLTRTWPDCLMAMQHGQVDAVYSDSPILSGLRAQDPNTEMMGTSDHTDGYGVAVAPQTVRDTSGLVRQVNATLERMRGDGSWSASYDRWLAPYMGSGTQPEAVYRSGEESTELREIRTAAGTTATATPTASTTAPDDGSDGADGATATETTEPSEGN